MAEVRTIASAMNENNGVDLEEVRLKSVLTYFLCSFSAIV